MKKILITLAVVLLLPTLVLAQAQTTGQIAGKVTDEGGSPVAGADVEASSNASATSAACPHTLKSGSISSRTASPSRVTG